MVTKTEKTTEAETKAAPALTTAPTQATAPAGAPIGDQPVGGLSIGDLRNLATIMDVASTRGAFRANEMATVGLLYNKLNQFLTKVAPQGQTEPSLASNPTATAQPSKKE